MTRPRKRQLLIGAVIVAALLIGYLLLRKPSADSGSAGASSDLPPSPFPEDAGGGGGGGGGVRLSPRDAVEPGTSFTDFGVVDALSSEPGEAEPDQSPFETLSTSAGPATYPNITPSVVQYTSEEPITYTQAATIAAESVSGAPGNPGQYGASTIGGKFAV